MVKKNFLLLGIDSLPNRGSVAPLTDTILFISLDIETGSIQTLSLPRDLWSEEYKTKINALYSYGIERYPEEPERFTREVLSELLNVEVHHTLVLSLETVREIIDTIGGVEVTVTEGFTDTQFPRSDVDIHTERDPAKLYKTVTFETGKQTMDGERVLEFVRSRYSAGDTGTDISRGNRQQQVLDAILNKFRDTELLTDPKKLGALFRIYNNTFADVLSFQELISTGKALYPVRHTITHNSAVISIYPENPYGVLVNPPVKKYEQWVYEIRDLEKFRKEVQTDLGFSHD